MKTLILYSLYTDQMSYFDDWIDAFKEHPEYTALGVNVLVLSHVLKRDEK